MLVVIPAHNEEANIGALVTRVAEICPKAQVLVVDDGSTDRTAHEAMVAEATVVFNPSWAEYGDGFRAGLRHAVDKNHNPIVFMDAGLSHDPKDIPRLVAALKHGETVVGSRVVPGAEYCQGWRRRLLTHIGVRLFAMARRDKEWTDYSGFRAMSYSVAWDLSTMPELWLIPCRRAHAFNLYLLDILLTHFKVVQVPIRFTGTNSTLSLRRVLDAAIAWWRLIR